MSDNKSFYVYVHIRLDTGDVFYVGKGSGTRYKGKNGRNRYWEYIVNKCGYRWEIKYDNLSEGSAFKIEAELISFYRGIGIKLANFTDGGEGVSGCFPSEETLEKLRAVAETRKIPVWSSDGRRFNGLTDAAKAMRDEGFNLATPSGIMASCKSDTRVAYDMRWSYYGVPDHNGITSEQRVHKSRIKMVYSSDGMSFDGTRSAAAWLRGNGYPNATHNPIVRACRDEWRIAYGRKWSYAT